MMRAGNVPELVLDSGLAMAGRSTAAIGLVSVAVAAVKDSQ
jgi:hypothetical protein